MIRTMVITLCCLALGLPLAAAIVALLGRMGGLPPAQVLYLSLVAGPILWTALHVLVLWVGTSPHPRKPRT